MNIRKAKRLKIGRYREEGFHVRLFFDESAGNTDALLDRFLESIESVGLCTYMSCNKSIWEGIVMRDKPYRQTSSDDRLFCRELALELGAVTCATSKNFDVNSEKAMESSRTAEDRDWEIVEAKDRK